ncbi:peptidoglycan DD-metalloendopeptidase family protein [Deinococcus sp. YIM 134068]|uniref:murein hydrolase activator EnvC family protein n=1 Tax=Deinococcus lichenicola TaxID=3118910 RepID=UPI002F925356
MRPRWAIPALLSAALLAGAQTTSERLESLQRELQQQRRLSTGQRQELERLRANIQNLTAQQRQTLTRLDALAGSVAALENEAARLRARVALAERQLADITERRELTGARVARLQGDVRELLNALYRERSGQYLQLLSQSASLSDLLIRLRYANRAGQYNIEVIERLRGEVQTLAAQGRQQEEQTATLKALQAERLAGLERLRDRRAEQQTLLTFLRRSEQGQRTLATRTRAEQVLTAQTIDQLVGAVVQERTRLEAERRRRLEEERRRREAELRRIREAQERARQEALRLARVRAEQERQAREQAAREAALAAQREREARLQREQAALREREAQEQRAAAQVERQLAPLPALSGPVGFPLPGGSVTQPYGANGAQWVVLGAPDGAVAVAALEGNVIATTYYASLGWVVLIDHGPTVTAYFGLQDSQVSVGNRVARGTPLGMVGGSPIFGPGQMAFQLNSVQGGTRRPMPPPF